jgi:hypothetical protein
MRNLAIVAFLLCLLATCGPKDTIPKGPDHPANPEARGGSDAAPGAAAVNDDKRAIAAAEQTALKRAQPVFDKYCVKCHSSAGKEKTDDALDHLSMDAYPFGGEHAMEIGQVVREALGTTGKAATMPMDRPGAVQGAELDVVLEWTKAFDRSHGAGVHEGHEHHHGH